MRVQATDRGSRVELRDGRVLSYAECGPPDGTPVVYCHGAIGTPLGRWLDLESLTARLRIRYIAVNRPGIGGSDRAPRRAVLDFAADLEQLADKLSLGRFAVVGVSAGGPFALAAGSGLGDRIVRIAVCSSLSPLCEPHRAPAMPPQVRLALKTLGAAPGLCAAAGDAALPVLRRRPELLHAVIRAHAAPTERARLREADERAAATASFLEATAYGVRGMIDDSDAIRGAGVSSSRRSRPPFTSGTAPRIRWCRSTTRWRSRRRFRAVVCFCIPTRGTTSSVAGWRRSWRRC